MPQIDLRRIQCAEYQFDKNTKKVSYGSPIPVGDAMNVNIQPKFAEGRLYAESSLAEYIRKITGGTLSIGVKYIPVPAQILMFGFKQLKRTVGSATVASLAQGAKDSGKYVGVSMYAPDMIDGVEKYTGVFISKSRFGAPAMVLATQGQNIVFQTPTTSGEFLPDDRTGRVSIEVAICDTEEDVIAWCDAVFTDEGTEVEEAAAASTEPEEGTAE